MALAPFEQRITQLMHMAGRLYRRDCHNSAVLPTDLANDLMHVRRVLKLWATAQSDRNSTLAVFSSELWRALGVLVSRIELQLVSFPDLLSDTMHKIDPSTMLSDASDEDDEDSSESDEDE
jgi:hypothetical protein